MTLPSLTLPAWTPSGPLPTIERFGVDEEDCGCRGYGNDPNAVMCRACEIVGDALDGYEAELADPPCQCWWTGGTPHDGHCCFRPGKGAPPWVDGFLEGKRESNDLPYCHDEDDGDRRAAEIEAHHG